MTGAGAALRGVVREALVAIGGFGVHDAGPVQAAFPHAVVECGPESDWGLKGGDGREVRVAVVIRDRGEAPERVHAIGAEVETALPGIGGSPSGWQVVSLRHVRTRWTREAGGWAGAVEFRGRMLRV